MKVVTIALVLAVLLSVTLAKPAQYRDRSTSDLLYEKAVLQLLGDILAKGNLIFYDRIAILGTIAMYSDVHAELLHAFNIAV